MPGKGLAQQRRCYGAVQPVRARVRVLSVVWSTEVPGLTVTALLVADVGEQVNSVLFRVALVDPSARPSIVYIASLVELGATTLLPFVLSYVPTATALAGTVTEYPTQSSELVAQPPGEVVVTVVYTGGWESVTLLSGVDDLSSTGMVRLTMSLPFVTD
jgi:hypothetical protein